MKVLILLIVLSVVSKLTGLFRELSIGFVFGPGEILDTFIVVMMIPSIVLDVMSSCINSCYVPIHKKYFKSNPIVLMVIFSVCVVISILFSLFVYFINLGILLKFNWNEAVINSEYVLAFSLPASIYVFVCTLNEFFKSILACENKAPLIPVITIFANAVFVISIYTLSDIIGDSVIAYSYCAFAFTQMLFGLIFTKKYLLNSFFEQKKTKENRRKLFVFKFLILIVPVSIGSISNQINKSVDKYLASSFDSGSISQLYFSQQLYSVLVGLLIVNVVTFYYPKICESIKDEYKLKKTVNESLYLLTFMSLLISVIVYHYKYDFVSIVMGYGKLKGSLEGITVIFSLYTFGLAFEAISAVFKRVMWAGENTVTPVRVSVFGIFLNVMLSVYLSSLHGVYGIVLATVVSNLIICVVLGTIVHKTTTQIFFLNWLIRDILFILPIVYFVSYYVQAHDFNKYENLAFSVVTFMLGFGCYLLRRVRFERKI
ncbi:lipid II flippase MurJ [Vibrio crassostreae]|uniref:lipid II flippase MurJ n=1 Tax=Vibrio crassostreae TaxID=246167 RepID=UPI000F49A88C|nr:lipid II flippase MurJ [Vibrio crassostreae]ROP20132.1 peptidoglycan biosynthesis protein MviN/MurJ (putative lipid II flippase) [Vibrio crassostreae]ROP21777.1 peptidoglycan biosynthesis protein MviN/MurJ (putative lipid II flippase) [Vibrio crassostreae]RPE97615.1 peptidoglycan biosynthesis protein MviN/MurJ (putative lipid II flippase) [Vibrio crassostreae]RPE99921.1 peptidoglycan biosynthesis protein MviN/MurJ (putative lipid II flippase) [Vibrio crassostreae]TCN70909.1 peptidoglycan bi